MWRLWMSQSCFSLGFLSQYSLEALYISWVWGVFILVCVWNVKSQFFQNRAGWRLGLVTWLSREFKPWANWVANLDFCPVVLQLAWLFSFPACSACVQLLAACKPQVTREIQPRVPASLHSLEHFFTFSHTLPLHDSHLNTGLLIAKLRANLARNKANKMVDKISTLQQPQMYIYQQVQGLLSQSDHKI